MSKPVRTLAKVSRPNAPLIGRQDLVTSIVASSPPLVWITAPAGSGKTSLGMELTQSLDSPAGWLRLDEADIDLASFLHFLEQAFVAGGAVDIDWARPQLSHEHLPAPQGYMRLFLRALAERIASNTWLVLDDAHKCQESPFFSVFLDTLVEELPQGMRILILSRALPSDGCSRLLAHGQIHLVDAEVMAFSVSETEILLRELGLPNPERICDMVFGYTQGWAAGIALVASWLKRSPDAASRLGEIPQLVAGYLANEVFSTLNDGERETLLSVSVLPYFRTEWAETLSGVVDAAAILGRLATQGVLIYQYPGKQFTLHPLFQQFLRLIAEERVLKNRRQRWIERGIQLLEADNNAEDAIELALAYGSLSYAASLIETCADKMLASARHQTLGRWISLLPEASRGPWHHYWMGLAYNVSDTRKARESFHRAYDAFSATGDSQHRFVALSMIVVSYSFNGVAEEPLSSVLQRVGDVEQDYARLTDLELRANLTLGIFCGLMTTDPGHVNLGLWEDRSLEALSLQISPATKVRLAVWLGIHWFFSGQYRRINAVRKTLDSLLDPKLIPSYQHYLIFFLHQFDSLVHCDHAALAKSFAVSRQVSEETGFRTMNGHYALQYAASCMIQGEMDTVRTLLAQVTSATPPGYYNQVGHLCIVQSWAAAWAGNNAAALEFSHRIRDAGRSFGSAAYEIWSQVMASAASTLEGNADASRHIAELRQSAERAGYFSGRIHADFLEAWHLLKEGDKPGALLCLERGLALLGLESDGFLWGAVPQILLPLCVLALRENVEVEAACSVIRTFRLLPPADAPANWPWPISLRCFGEFELRIDGKPFASRGKSRHRQLDLLKLLAAHAPAPLQLTRIAGHLWPDSDSDASLHALETTLSRLRGTLGRDVFRVELGTVVLDRNICRIDTAVLDTLVQRLEATTTMDAEEMITIGNTILDIYSGELLPGESATWLLPRRDYWRRRVARCLNGAATTLDQAGPVSEAIRLLERALDTDPYSEPMTATLMAICLRHGRNAEGMAAYRRYCRMASTVLGVTISDKIQDLAQRLQIGVE